MSQLLSSLKSALPAGHSAQERKSLPVAFLQHRFDSPAVAIISWISGRQAFLSEPWMVTRGIRAITDSGATELWFQRWTSLSSNPDSGPLTLRP